jgi:hypothetical protein
VAGDEAAIQKYMHDYLEKIGLDVDIWEQRRYGNSSQLRRVAGGSDTYCG